MLNRLKARSYLAHVAGCVHCNHNNHISNKAITACVCIDDSPATDKSDEDPSSVSCCVRVSSRQVDTGWSAAAVSRRVSDVPDSVPISLGAVSEGAVALREMLTSKSWSD